MGKRQKGNRRLRDKRQEVKQAASDEWQNDYIKPPYNIDDLIKLVESSDILGTLTRTYASNLMSYGWGVKYRDDFDYANSDKATQTLADQEWNRLEYLYKYFNVKESFNQVMKKVIQDRETIGFGTLEIIRNGQGEICGGEYVSSNTIRIVQVERKDRFVNITQTRVLKDGGTEEVECPTTFKKFVQITSMNNGNPEKIYFKEFGDPRDMDWRDGEYKDSVEPDYQATEIVYFGNHCSWSQYGTPRWAGNCRAASGNIKSEEVNLKFFENGKIVPFAIIVNGGQLTEESMEVLETGKGLKNAFNCLLLEGLAPENIDRISDDKREKVDIKIQPLIDTSLKDGMFIEEQKWNDTKMQRDFRLPSIYLGVSQDYTRATSEVAKIVTEEQVFAPDREEIAQVFNSIVNNEFGISCCEMYFKGPDMGNITELATAIQPFITAGTVTPNMLIDTVGKLLGKDLEEFDDDWGNTPIEILKLNRGQNDANKEDGKELNEEEDEEELKKEKTLDLLDDMTRILEKYCESN